MSVWEHLGPMLDPQDLALVLNIWHGLLYIVCFVSVYSHCVCILCITYLPHIHSHQGPVVVPPACFLQLWVSSHTLTSTWASAVKCFSLQPFSNTQFAYMLSFAHAGLYTLRTDLHTRNHAGRACSWRYTMQYAHVCTLTSHNTQHTHTPHTYHISHTVGYTTHINDKPDLQIISLRHTQTCPHIWFTLVSWSQTGPESWDPTTGSEVSLGHPGVQTVLDPLPWSSINRCWLCLWIVWTSSL